MANLGFIASELSLKVKENNSSKVAIVPVEKPEDRYRPGARKNSLLVAVNLSLKDSDPFLKTALYREKFKETARIRGILKKEGISLGKGFSEETFRTGLKALEKNGFSSKDTKAINFSYIGEKSGVSAVFRNTEGLRVLYLPGINNPVEDRGEKFVEYRKAIGYPVSTPKKGKSKSK